MTIVSGKIERKGNGDMGISIEVDIGNGERKFAAITIKEPITFDKFFSNMDAIRQEFPFAIEANKNESKNTRA